jgi:hypothetical protein
VRWSVTVRSDARLWEIDAAVSGGREGFRFVADEVAAMPGQQIGDTVDRMCCDALEEVAQIGFRLDIVEIREAMAAARTPPASDPANSQFFRPKAIGRIARSTGLLSISMVPSSV